MAYKLKCRCQQEVQLFFKDCINFPAIYPKLRRN